MKRFTAKEVQEKLENGEQLNIIDVREVDEVKEGKIPNAIHIPLGLVEFKMNELDKKKQYVMVCRSGARSGRAATYLEGQGFDVINMDGGMMAYEGKTN
ncbi:MULTISPECIES: rhodanese-like domain-containing protein [unclassified Exiguobacterium]|uniref:rhodanese-like domain-containing protein n=1 Tax=unclassified Exiguobacterium TaxID=2644629 RepID=UPI000DF7F410|nr:MULTISPECIES: rhodanese-like domain-containing protein [unclassified Exiguobacterium]MDX1260991.1 rhodanese-like domain-containing protein [Exiguobacterium sp. K1]RDB32522.1 rhodanese-like domain-containing protein [Exiguobacterium sp. RIT594]HCN58400.1 rhodanese [Exiguobacterium sp.]